MIIKQTVIERIEIVPSGHVQIRFALLLVENGTIISHSWHRTALEPGADVDERLAAVNADITVRPNLMASPIEREETPFSVLSVAKVKQTCAMIHTPEMVAKYKAAQLTAKR